MRILPKLVNFALFTVKKYQIDESHGLSHAINVLHHSHNILESEIGNYPQLDEQRNIVYTSALMHDLCDKKYMSENEGSNNIIEFLSKNTTLADYEVDIVHKIITTMSYSKVKNTGYPDLGIYQMAYHIVREADLLSAYDVERSIIYKMNHESGDFNASFQDALTLFDNRMFKHNEDKLFVTKYSKHMSRILEKEACLRIKQWKIILEGTT